MMSDREMLIHWLVRDFNKHSDVKVIYSPAVAWGRPRLEASGVPTASLYNMWRAEGSGLRATMIVAKEWEISQESVATACDFEEKLRKVVPE